MIGSEKIRVNDDYANDIDEREHPLTKLKGVGGGGRREKRKNYKIEKGKYPLETRKHISNGMMPSVNNNGICSAVGSFQSPIQPSPQV